MLRESANHDVGILLCLVALCSAAVCGGCAAADDEPPPVPVDPLSWSLEQPGPYGVGFTRWETSYLAPGSSVQRTVPVSLWYPTEETSGEGITYEFIFADDDSWLDAAPAAAVYEGGYPVHAYSHGHMGFAGSSSFLMRAFASHGWVAVAPDHLGNTLSTNTEPRPLSLWLDRAGDVSAALDSLLQRAPELLGGEVDPDRSVLSGHSFGGYTTWSAMGAAYDRQRIEARCADGDYPQDQCSDSMLDAFEAGAGDERFTAGIPLAGKGSEDWFGEDGLRAVDRPML